MDRYAAFDGNGRIEYELFNGATKGMKFAYDDLGRVIADTIQAVTITGCSEEIEFGGFLCSPTAWSDVIETNAYAYDSVGNRKDSGGTYSTGNRITAFGTCTSFAHDDNGNMTSRTCGGVTTTYTWRKDNKLASVSSGGTTYSLRYDALGRLTRLDQGGSAIRYFLWQGDNLLAELNGTGTAVQLEYSYYPGLDNLHAVKKDSLYMAHKDPRGNVIALTNADSKSVGRSYTYTSWGELHTGSDGAGFNDVDRARWKGALWFDEIGLYYMRARWYDASLGRFISEDPIGLSGGINNYGFGEGDPVNTSDPTGLASCRRLVRVEIVNGREVGRTPLTPWTCDDEEEGGGQAYGDLKERACLVGLGGTLAQGLGPNGPSPFDPMGTPGPQNGSMTFGISGSLSLNFGVLPDGRMVGIAQGGLGAGFGTYYGGGAQVGIVTLPDGLQTGVTYRDKGSQFVFNVAIPEFSAGASISTDFDGFSVSFYRMGIGVGAQASVELTRSWVRLFDSTALTRSLGRACALLLKVLHLG